MTVREAYDYAVNVLNKEAHYDLNEARISARLLVDNLAQCDNAYLLRPDVAIEERAAISDFYRLLKDLKSGKPLAYVLHQRVFFGLPFLCEPSALIPRPETELLVERVLMCFKNRDRVLVADLGTGTGCVAISIAHSLPQALVYATDLSRDALILAADNADIYDLQDRVKFVEGQSGEWAQPLVREGFAGMFNCVVSNPPYISKRDIEELPTQIKDFEPRLALDGGDDGLSCYRDIARQCGVLLQPNGFLLAELGAGQFGEVRAIFEREGWNVAPPILDLAGHERVLSATRRD
jgi:release factor glutamine methyltransferase